jgi:hypothetical protein
LRSSRARITHVDSRRRASVTLAIVALLMVVAVAGILVLSAQVASMLSP